MDNLDSLVHSLLQSTGEESQYITLDVKLNDDYYKTTPKNTNLKLLLIEGPDGNNSNLILNTYLIDIYSLEILLTSQMISRFSWHDISLYSVVGMINISHVHKSINISVHRSNWMKGVDIMVWGDFKEQLSIERLMRSVVH